MADETEDDQVDYHLGRFFALTDGIFAIAITLLVLGLALPAGLSGSALDSALGNLAPSLLAVALTFLVIARLWVSHQRVFNIVRRLDRAVVALNFGYLAPLVLLPFATEVLADYGNRTLGVVLYAIPVAVCALVMAALWTYLAARPRLRAPHTARHDMFEQAVRSLATAVVFLASIGVAVISPTAAEFFWLALFVSDQVALAIAGRLRRLRRLRRDHRAR